MGSELTMSRAPAELRTFVLAHGTVVMGRPFVAAKLARLCVYFCDFDKGSSSRPFTASGCPSLQHVFLGFTREESPGPVDDSLLFQVGTLGVELFDSSTDAGGMGRALTASAVSNQALLEKALFDLLSSEADLLFDVVGDAKHLRVHVMTDFSAPHADRIADLADVLDVAFPHLETLYLPLALDTSHVMLFRDMRSALTKLVDACAQRRVEVVFEHDLDADQAGEDRASPHFEGRCRRIKAERAAAASATTSGARAAS